MTIQINPGQNDHPFRCKTLYQRTKNAQKTGEKRYYFVIFEEIHISDISIFKTILLKRFDNLPDSIASLIKSGKVKDAAKELGYFYSIKGTVIKGNELGRSLGFPTANISVDHIALLPAKGVYAALVYTGHNWYKAMVNIGVRPTLNLDQLIIESHLFDFDNDLYKKEINVHFIEKIRQEKKFDTTRELKEQLEKDKDTALLLLKRTKARYKPGSSCCYYIK